MVGGGLAALRSRVWLAFAGGAALTFLGIFAVTWRAIVAVDDATDLELGIALYVWGLAALGSLGAVGLTFPVLRLRPRAALPFVISAAGVAWLWIGVLVPSDGLSFGDHLWSGDTNADAAMVVVLAGLPAAAVALVVFRTVAAAAFACGVVLGWLASWFVFAFDGTAGGLLVPWADTPVLAALGFLLALACILGAAGIGAGAGAGATGGGLAVAPVGVIVLCAGAGVLVLGSGVAAAGGSPGSAAWASALASSDFADSSAGQTVTAEGFDEAVDLPTEAPTTAAPVPTTRPAPAPTTTIATTSCVASVCQPPVGTWIVSLGQYNTEADAVAALPDHPATGVIRNNEYSSLVPDLFMVFYDGGYTSGEAAVQYCHEIGRPTRDVCFARLLDDTPGLDPADPALIVYPDE
jgi:hypothetical protein